jgi:hypothetical protein
MLRTTIALATGLVCWLLLASGLALWAGGDQEPSLISGLQTGQAGLAIAVMFTLTWLEVAVVGTLVASRRPASPIGWIIVAASLLASLQSVANGYSVAGNNSRSEQALIAWFGSWVGAPALGLIVVALLLIPDGRLPFRWSRLLVWLVLIASAIQAVGFALQPGLLRGSVVLANPLATASDGVLVARDAATVALVAGMLTAAVSLAVRLSRARGQERQQLKWVAYAAVLFAMGFAALSFSSGDWRTIGVAAFALSGAALTTAVGVAILRYQLFDIDLLINRTLVYGSVVVLLLATYTVGVVLLELLLSPFTRGSEVATALSTLAVAALAGPAMRRTRAAIDRRFYRRQYDAARTLEAFGARLRQDLDLDSVSADLLGTVQETMQPTRISLWVRTR